MALVLTEEQQMYAEAVGAFFDRQPETGGLVEADRAPAADQLSDAWEQLHEAFDAVALPLPDGLGAGGSWQDVGIVLEAAGRTVSPLPYLAAMTAVRLLQSAACADADTELKAAVAGTRVQAALSASTCWTHLEPIPTQWRAGLVRGTVPAVLDAAHAEVFIVPVRDAGGIRLAVVNAADVEVTPRPGLDLTRSFGDVTFPDCAGRLLDCADPEAALRAALLFAAVGVAADAVGGAQRCVDMTVRYVQTREQFGTVVGSYQAVKHALADVVRALEPARAANRDALDALDALDSLDARATADPQLPRLAAVTRLSAADAYVRAAGVAIQLHGAIGFTWEHRLHHFFKRAVTSRALFGSTREHRAVLQDCLLREVREGGAA